MNHFSKNILRWNNLGHRQLWVLQFLYFYAAHCTHWSFVLGMVLYDLYPMVTIDVISYIASVACSNPIMQLIFYFLCSTTASVTQFYSQISTQVVVYILWGIIYSGQSCCNSLWHACLKWKKIYVTDPNVGIKI